MIYMYLYPAAFSSYRHINTLSVLIMIWNRSEYDLHDVISKINNFQDTI